MRLALALSALALAACTPAPPTGKAFTFTCPAGETFTVRYDNGATAAFVSYKGQDHRLPAAMSASGARYTDGAIEFWEKGGEAMLNGAPGGDLSACKLQES